VAEKVQGRCLKRLFIVKLIFLCQGRGYNEEPNFKAARKVKETDFGKQRLVKCIKQIS
jgi:hypothetical protein